MILQLWSPADLLSTSLLVISSLLFIMGIGLLASFIMPQLRLWFWKLRWFHSLIWRAHIIHFWVLELFIPFRFGPITVKIRSHIIIMSTVHGWSQLKLAWILPWIHLLKVFDCPAWRKLTLWGEVSYWVLIDSHILLSILQIMLFDLL